MNASKSVQVKKVKNILIQYKQVVDELVEQKEKFLSKKLKETNNDTYLSQTVDK